MTRRRFRNHGRILSDEARELIGVGVAMAVALAAALLNGAQPDGPPPQSDKLTESR